jgi:hypothetical protein
MAGRKVETIVTGKYVDNITTAFQKSLLKMKATARAFGAWFSPITSAISLGFKGITSAASFAYSAITKGAKYAAIGLGVMAGAIAYAVSQYAEAEQAERRLIQLLKNRGEYTKEVMQAIQAQAKALSRLTGIDDDYILGLMTVLATSKNLALDTLPRVTQAILDMAAATGDDAHAVAELFMRALEGNFMALKRYGIVIDDVTFKQRGFGAVLDSVESKFKGQSAVLRGTTGGAATAVKTAFGNLVETVGKQFAPAIVEALKWIGSAFEQLDDWISTSNIKTKVVEFFTLDLHIVERWERIEKAWKAMQARKEPPRQPRVVDLSAEMVDGTLVITQNLDAQVTRTKKNVDSLWEILGKAGTNALNASLDLMEKLITGRVIPAVDSLAQKLEKMTPGDIAAQWNKLIVSLKLFWHNVKPYREAIGWVADGFIFLGKAFKLAAAGAEAFFTAIAKMPASNRGAWAGSMAAPGIAIPKIPSMPAPARAPAAETNTPGVFARARDAYMGAASTGWEMKLYDLLKQLLSRDNTQKVEINIGAVETKDPKELARLIRLELLRLERSGVGT